MIPSYAVVISYNLWKREFGGQEDVLGAQLYWKHDVYTVIGIFPPNFRGVDLEEIDLWLPLSGLRRAIGKDWYTYYDSSVLEVFGRLDSSLTEEQAEREVSTILRRAMSGIRELGPDDRILLAPIQHARRPGKSTGAQISTWATGMSVVVFLIACLNVMNLIYVRGINQRRELEIRLTLGARPRHIIVESLSEGLLLSVLGALIALVFGATLVRLAGEFLFSPGFPIGAIMHWRLLLIGALLSMASAAICGTIPAIFLLRRQIYPIQAAARGGYLATHGLQNLILAGQFALTLTLLINAGLFWRSLQKLCSLDLGLDAGSLLIATVDSDLAEHHGPVFQTLYRNATAGIYVPGVVAQFAFATSVPFESSSALELEVPGLPELPKPSTGGPYVTAVSEQYFTTMGMTLVRGRAFTRTDRLGSERVAVVNKTMAQLLWPGEDAIGECLKIGGRSSPCTYVVGIVKDSRRAEILEEPTMQYYVPLKQAPDNLRVQALFLRVSPSFQDSSEIAVGIMRRQLLDLLSPLPYINLRKFSDIADRQVRPWRIGAKVFTIFGMLSLAVGAIGVYGLTGYTVARRRQELAVRIALGAHRGHLLRLIFSQIFSASLVGCLLGAVLSRFSRDLVGALLFGIGANDWTIFLLSSILLLITALTACHVPLWRIRRLSTMGNLHAIN